MSSGLFGVYSIFLLYCFRNPFCFIPSSFRVVFGAFLCLFRLFPVLPSESFGVAPVFSPCYLRNTLVFILPFFRIALEPFCVCIVFALCLFYFCLFFVLFSNRICVSSV